MKTLILLSTLNSLLSLPALARDGGGSSVGNPAAQFCIDLGGQLERTHTSRGESANCVIEEWSLYREMDKEHLVRPIHCRPNAPCMPNPAARNCYDVGGAYRLVTTPQGETGMCVVEEWALWKIFH